MARSRIGLLLAAFAAATAVALSSAAGAAGSKARTIEREWTGTTSNSQYRNLGFESLSSRRGKPPYKVKQWGMGSPLTCTGPEAPYQGYQNFPGYVGAVGGEFPGGGRGGKLRVRKGNFGEHAVYNADVYGIAKRIEYNVTGHFANATNVAGTLQVTTLWSWPDGGRTSCTSGAVTWSACAWDTAYIRIQVAPPCAGYSDTDPIPGEL